MQTMGWVDAAATARRLAQKWRSRQVCGQQSREGAIIMRTGGDRSRGGIMNLLAWLKSNAACRHAISMPHFFNIALPAAVQGSQGRQGVQPGSGSG